LLIIEALNHPSFQGVLKVFPPSHNLGIIRHGGNEMNYEYKEISGDEYESRFGTETCPVSVDDINQLAKEGWRFVCFRGNGHTAIMERGYEAKKRWV